MSEVDQSRPTIVVVGSVHMDLVATADRLPVRGETLPGRSLSIRPGGKAGFQAVQVARAGSRSILVGLVGRDEFGRRLRDALSQEGVVVDWLSADPHRPTGASVVLVGEEGDYCSVIVPGAGLALTPSRLDMAQPAFAAADVMIAQLELSLETTIAALTRAREAGAMTILNAAPAPENPESLDPLFALVDVLVVNEVEARMLSGGEGDLDRAMDRIQDRWRAAGGSGKLIVTLGGRGALVASGERRAHLEGHQVQVIDTVGAGDAFVGMLAAAIAEGVDFVAAAERANAAGALAVSSSGAYNALPTTAEVDAFLDRASKVGR